MNVEHPESTRKLLLVGLALVILVGVSWGMSYVHVPGWNEVIALGIALVKCALVMLVFMELDRSHWSIRVIATVGLGYVLLLVIVSSLDPATREPPPLEPAVPGTTSR